MELAQILSLKRTLCSEFKKKEKTANSFLIVSPHIKIISSRKRSVPGLAMSTKNDI